MSDSNELTGTIKKMFEIQTFDSGFTKREVIIETDETYAQEIKVEFLKDKVEKLDDYKEGDKVTVGYNLRGREHDGKWYNSLIGWRISAAKAAEATEAVEEEALPF